MNKQQRRKNQQLIAQAMGVPLASYETECKLNEIAREAAGMNKGN